MPTSLPSEPLAPTPTASPYERCGGEAGIRFLTRRFYEVMDSLPEGKAARALHPPSLHAVERKLFEYLSGWLGGPQLFVERYGPPMLRRRHLHAPIGPEAVQSWLFCFHRAWQETIEDKAIGDEVLPQIEALAHHMRNILT